MGAIKKRSYMPHRQRNSDGGGYRLEVSYTVRTPEGNTYETHTVEVPYSKVLLELVKATKNTVLDWPREVKRNVK